MALPDVSPTAGSQLHAEQILAHFEQLEAQFNQLRQGLTRSHRLTTLGMLSSIIAHETNNILTPVISYAQLALAKPDDHEMLVKAAEKALQGALRATQISSSLLGFARESDGQQIASIVEVVQDAVACLGRDPKRDGIDLILTIPDLRAMISPLSLQQVILNLLLNARQAMKRQGGQIRVTATQSGNHTIIRIADTGPGIPEEVRETLFEPFVSLRNEDPASGERKGTGLGLCICRDIVVSAGGTITFESTKGRGTTFIITLPSAEPLFEST